MKVYSVSYGIKYEPGQISGVFLSLDSANARRELIISKTNMDMYWVEVEAHEVQS